MKVIFAFARTYPRETLIVLVAIVIAGMVEGVSMTAMLPALSIGIDGTEPSSSMGRKVVEIFHTLHLEPTVTSLLGVVVIGTVVTSLITLLAKRKVGYTVAHVATDLRLALLRALLAARWEYYLRQPVGKLTNAMSSQAGEAAKAYLNAAALIAAAIQAGAYITVALLVSWEATIAYVAAALVISVALHRLVRVARRAGKRQTKMQSRLMAGLGDTLLSVKPLKAMGRENLADQVLVSQTLDLNESLRRQVTSKEGRKAIQQPLFAILLAAGAWFGLEVWKLSMAEVMVLLLLLSRVLGNLGRVQEAQQELATSSASYWALRETLDEAQHQPEPEGGELRPHFEREIRFEAVEFAYDREPVLDGCSLTIPFGSIVSLVGESGAGKTTILDLVVGLVRPQKGRVSVDDIDLSAVELRAWRHMIGYVPQENLLLHASVKRNVTLDDPELTDADVEYALRAAGAWDFVEKLPDGVRTMVGERGSRFSGGQRQRITIARALAHRPRLLILDEATASLDPATEAALCDTLTGLRGTVTVLAISHQRALIEAADRVYRIEGRRARLEIDRQEMRDASAARRAVEGEPADHSPADLRAAGARLRTASTKA